MQVVEIQAHNKVNIIKLDRVEQKQFLEGIGAVEVQPYVYTTTQNYGTGRYYLCAYLKNGDIIINSGSNRRRLRNLLQQWQHKYNSILARVVVINSNWEAKHVGQ